ncbi:hypothetical protein EDD21DRAFT_218317 [Dissophora ornata]|nr:hypothetical protein BGZ58_011194 [Dissophora ornata]KAI8597382.1 hypothetical protein EDD21DRAFT_218317 [Dissophora ornata]
MTDAIQDLYTSYRIAEHAWSQSISRASSSPSIEESSLHYGELAFVLAGLKPCVLIQLPTPDLTLNLYRNVLTSYWTQLSSFKQHQYRYQQTSQEQGQGLELECRLITRNVRSPEMSLQGCVVIWSHTTVRSHPQAELIQRGIDLLFPSSEQDHHQEEDEKVISDHDLAVMLDIPGKLPETETEMQRMIEVSYWHQGDITLAIASNDNNNDNNNNNNNQPTLLTAFAAQPDQIPNIQTHFRRYRDTVRNMFGIQLKLHTRSIADMA